MNSLENVVYKGKSLVVTKSSDSWTGFLTGSVNSEGGNSFRAFARKIFGGAVQPDELGEGADPNARSRSWMRAPVTGAERGIEDR